MQNAFRQQLPLEKSIFPIEIYQNKGTAGSLVLPHWHDYVEFMKVLEGTVMVNINDINYRASKGDIIYINSQAIHSATILSSTAASSCAIVFDKFFITNYLEGFDTSYSYRLFLNFKNIDCIFPTTHPLWNELNQCLENISSEYKGKKTCYEMLIKSELYKLIAMILRHNKNHITGQHRFAPSFYSGEMETIRPILQYVEKNYDRHLDIKTVSRIINLSEYHFCRYFKKVTGLTFTEFLNRVRIDVSIRLLLNTGLSINEIYTRAGYTNASYFNKLFKETTGMTPLNFRKSCKSNFLPLM